ncbi:MAG: 1-(5-phosphoribosyl)-5-[(5-phosphoribosylamino)methylideneamino]imidazole-4-carboxamide isomerase [Alphaproteobacteria bacterium]|nr:1-(5-phosphoribosyl)-5-[(5-phosphoribosylamino)methylideneamino]imidazole-4-carboxamide isomerase [Alphaproteobacteria bacterium]HCQ71763.1 1-(5-phosphoribosyl)-5-((5-phosphoribosylamino)methylideneamino)imidazole-4-carboxamide isomerase [Rhodospirillaceae bacterium]|tara:strand:+ start:10681 stop:11406 length:726 start_codon:yes stop_codon:yes gene_type:complete
MIIYPAIDLKDGHCVRLYKGDMNRDVVYNENPADQAVTWARTGFSWIHVVDLNGAVDGKPVNYSAVKSILSSVDVPVQLGGGIRSLAQIEHWLSEGVSRVILGTVAVRDPDLVKKACQLFPDQIVVGIDARKGMVAVEGWVEESDMRDVDLAHAFEDVGVSAIIYTDIDRDGTGEGVNLERTCALAEATSIPVIASGGVGSLDDLRGVQKSAAEHHLNGVVVGRALYEGQLDPVEALKIVA